MIHTRTQGKTVKTIEKRAEDKHAWRTCKYLRASFLSHWQRMFLFSKHRSIWDFHFDPVILTGAQVTVSSRTSSGQIVLIPLWTCRKNFLIISCMKHLFTSSSNSTSNSTEILIVTLKIRCVVYLIDTSSASNINLLDLMLLCEIYYSIRSSKVISKGTKIQQHYGNPIQTSEPKSNWTVWNLMYLVQIANLPVMHLVKSKDICPTNGIVLT